jgi:hypothetical protein
MAYTSQFFGPRAFGSLFGLLRSNLGWDEEPLTQKLSTIRFENGHVFAYLAKELDSSEPQQLVVSDEIDTNDPKGARRAPCLFTYRFLQTRESAVALFVSDLHANDGFFQDLKRNPGSTTPHSLTPHVLIGEPHSNRGRFVTCYLKGTASPWDVEVAYRTTRLSGVIAVLTSIPRGTDLRPGEIISDGLLNALVEGADYVVFHIFCDSLLIWCREKPPESLLEGPDVSEYEV